MYFVTCVLQAEEWELVFNYLLPLPELLADARVNLRLHKIPLHLIGIITNHTSDVDPDDFCPDLTKSSGSV